MSFRLTTWYLEMRSRAQLRRKPRPDGDAELRRVQVALPAFSRFLYCAVGGDWHWRDRLRWSHARWLQHLDRPGVQTWVAYARGAPAGYIELERRDREVEIAYFGLLPEFAGHGLGGWLLGEGLARAWAMDARRVWVHTCNLDAPAALPNYRARGMTLYDTVTTIIDDPGPAAGPWPGAR